MADVRRRAIDAHVHIRNHSDFLAMPFPYRPATHGTLLTEMDAGAVERAVLVQPSVYGGDHTYLRHALPAHPHRFAAVTRLDPLSARALDLLDEPDASIPGTPSASRSDTCVP